MSVGVLLVDSCALVYGNPMCGKYINIVATSTFASTFGSLLVFLLNLAKAGQNDLLNSVRRTTLSPDAVIAALRRLLWRELLQGSQVSAVPSHPCHKKLEAYNGRKAANDQAYLWN